MKIIRQKTFTSVKDIKKIMKTPVKDIDKIVSLGGRKLKTLRKAMNADFTQKVRESSLKQKKFGLLTLAALPIGAGVGAVAGGAIGSNITRRDPNQKDIAYEIERLSKMKKALMNSKNKLSKGETVGENFYNSLVDESYDAADLLDQTLVSNDSYIIGDDDDSCDNSDKARQQYTKAIDQSIKSIDNQIAKTKKDGPSNWRKDYASHGAKLGTLVGVAAPIVASALTPDHVKRPIKKGIGIALGTSAALGAGYLAYKHYKGKKKEDGDFKKK